MLYITNGFSTKMLKDPENTVKFTDISKKEFDELKTQAKSYVGHHELAKRVDVDYNRKNLKLSEGDSCLCVSSRYMRKPTIRERYNVFDNFKNLRFTRIDVLSSKNQ